MNGITKEEWPQIVNKLQHSALPVPPSFVKDYDNWLCRSYAGRTLFSMGEYEDALMVLATVLEVQPDLNDKPGDGFSQAEHKVLCLLDMVELIMGLANNPGAALHYMDEAVKICNNFSGEFTAADPDNIWGRWQELQKLAGRLDSDIVWNPQVRKRPQELLDITEVRHRAMSGGQQNEFIDDISTIIS